MRGKVSLKARKVRKRRIVIDTPLFELINILEKYNKENNTKYSYGQFVMLLSKGIIKIERCKKI